MTTGVELAAAYVSLAVDGSQVDRGVTRALSGVSAQADRVGRESGRRMGGGISSGVLGAVTRMAGPLAAAFAGIGVGKILGDSISEALEAEKVSAATAAIVKSTGGAAKVTAEQVGALSEKLSEQIGVDDELIQSSANLLLTFKNVRNEVGKSNDIFNQALIAAQDISAAGFGSTESAAKMLGKALNDPVKGISALSRAGVTFTDVQKKQIKEMVKAGDVLGAQKVILGEIESQVGGVAKATATNADKIKVAWGNVKEQLGAALLPVFERVSKWFLEKGVPAIKGFIDFIDTKAIPGLGGLYDLLVKGDFTGALNKAFGWAEDSKPVDFLFRLRDAFLRIRDTAKGLFDLIINGDFTSALSKGLGVTEDSGFVDFILTARDAVITFVGWVRDGLWPVLKEGYERILPKVKEAFDTVREAFRGGAGSGMDIQWRDLAHFITGTLIPGITTLVEVWLPVAVKQFLAVKSAVEGVWGALMVLLDIQRTVASALITAFSTVTGWVVQMLRALSNVPGFGWAKDAADKLEGVNQKAQAVRDALNGIPNNIPVKVTFTTSGQVRLPDGTPVDMGVWKMREHGGPVRRGEPYIVGEKRPELFVPNQSGKILPSVPEASAGGFDSPAGTARDARLAQMIANALSDADLRVGVSEVARSLSRRRRDAVLSSPGR